MSRPQIPYFPTKEEQTDRQLGPILAVIRELQPFLLEEIAEPGSVPKDRSLDGGAASAATTTFIKACARLDSILEDAPRWTVKARDALIDAFIKTQKEQRRFIEVQRQSSEMLQAPHFILRPTLAISGGRYVAFWGNINIAGEAVVGQGDTPEEALLDFDDAFQRTPEEQIFLVAEKAGVDLKSNEKQNPPKN